MHTENRIIMALQVMPYKVKVHGASDIGLVRQNNEDSWKQLNEEHFYVLADGMGGHQAGEVASREAVENLCTNFHNRYDSKIDLTKAKGLLYKLIQEVNTHIYRMGRECSGLRGMGTTLCCILLHPEGLIYGHVGDSRIYRFRNHHLEQLTLDHSLLQELIDLGQLSEQQADDFLYKNIITKAIGTELYVDPSVKHTTLFPGDIILMCSDGLTDLVSYNDIQEILDTTPVSNMIKQLIKKAKQKGGFDNITAVLVKVQEKNDSNLS